MKFKIAAGTVLLLTLLGCAPEPYEDTQSRYVCEDKQAHSQFILQCIDNANPKSDEEPEDWIQLCKSMADESLCSSHSRIVLVTCTSRPCYSRVVKPLTGWE